MEDRQAKILKALHGVEGIVRVRLQVAQLDLNLVFRLLERRALQWGSSAIIGGLCRSFCIAKT